MPLEDKLHRLWNVPEFRHLIRSREAYFLPTSVLPFSFEYVRDLLRPLRFGWYATRDNWFHRVRLYVDETTLNVHLHHYHLNGHEILTALPEPGMHYFGGSVDRTRRYLDRYLNDGCLYLQDDLLLTYHLKNYGFVVVGPAPPSLRNNNNQWRRIRFHDWALSDIQIDRWHQLLEPSQTFQRDADPRPEMDFRMHLSQTIAPVLSLRERNANLGTVADRISSLGFGPADSDLAGRRSKKFRNTPDRVDRGLASLPRRHVEAFMFYQTVYPARIELERVESWTPDGGPGFGRIQEEAVEAFEEEKQLQ